MVGPVLGLAGREPGHSGVGSGGSSTSGDRSRCGYGG
jgi:hypothetical protein